MMKRIKRLLKNNSGVTIVESLMAFLMVCIAVTMLSSCIILAVSTISKGREATANTQETLKKFWASENPDKTETIKISFHDNKGNKGYISVESNRYDINELSIYEFTNPKATDNTDGE